MEDAPIPLAQEGGAAKQWEAPPTTAEDPGWPTGPGWDRPVELTGWPGVVQAVVRAADPQGRGHARNIKGILVDATRRATEQAKIQNMQSVILQRLRTEHPAEEHRSRLAPPPIQTLKEDQEEQAPAASWA